MIQYFTFVQPIERGKLQCMTNLLCRLYKGLTFQYEEIAQGPLDIDSRILASIEMVEHTKADGSTVDPVKAIDAMLLIFPAATKETAEEALDKVERWTGRDDVTIVDGVLVFPDLMEE